MPTLGITGGLGTGKSTVARLFGGRGAVGLSADLVAREVTAPGAPALREIADTFGSAYLLPDGSLDRGAMGALVFQDPDARQRLESITHPRILALLRQRMAEALESSPAGTVVAVEVPLLFEAGMADWFDRTLVVAASEAVQMARLVARDGLTEAEAHGRISAQLPLADKAASADYVVWNDDGVEALEAQIAAILQDIRSRSA